MTIFSTLATAIAAANASTTVQASTGTFSENVSITKPLTLKGADKTGTIIQGIYDATNAYPLSVRDASNVTMENFTVKPDPSGNFMFHTYSSPQSEKITLRDLIFDGSVNGVSTVRGVSLNHVKDVLIERCDLPATQNYSLGIGGVNGLVVKDSTLRASGWGTVGIFPSQQHPTVPVEKIDLSGGNTFVNGTGVGPATSGIIQIQPTAAVPITYGFSGAVNVTLPATFVNAYKRDDPVILVNSAPFTLTGITWATLTNNREIMRQRAAISALGASLNAIYGSNLQNGVTLYEDASYNLALAAARAVASPSKTIDFGAESAIPATKSDQYAIKFGNQIRVYDLSSAAVPRSLYPSQVVYLMPDSVSAGVPVLPKDVKALADATYKYAVDISANLGVRALQWYVDSQNGLAFLGMTGIEAQGILDIEQLSATPLDITNLIQVNGVIGASATIQNTDGSITGSIVGLAPTQTAPVASINNVVDVPPTGQVVTIDVSGQQPIKIVEPSGAAVELVVKDPANIDATFTVPVNAGQVAVQVLGPGEFIVSRKADNDNTNNVSIVFDKVTYVIDDNGRVVSNTGEQVALLDSNGRFTIQQPGPRPTGNTSPE